MPKGYVILTETINDPEAMGAYGKAAGPTIAAHGGNVLVAAQGLDVREGSWPATQTVIVEFASVENARSWYESSDYQAAATLRQKAADCDVVIAPGFERPTV